MREEGRGNLATNSTHSITAALPQLQPRAGNVSRRKEGKVIAELQRDFKRNKRSGTLASAEVR
jgi:predicted DNA-binding protein (UPF0278 family)